MSRQEDFEKASDDYVEGEPDGAQKIVGQDGICTNPQMDCINCPKRGDGGTWSTNISIKAEDAPLQEWFNDNKED